MGQSEQYLLVAGLGCYRSYVLGRVLDGPGIRAFPYNRYNMVTSYLLAVGLSCYKSYILGRILDGSNIPLQSLRHGPSFTPCF